jgi:hypothetical protein
MAEVEGSLSFAGRAVPGELGRSDSAAPAHVAPEHEHLLRSVQDGRKALRRATLALTFSIISATGAWTNFTVTAIRALHHH